MPVSSPGTMTWPRRRGRRSWASPPVRWRWLACSSPRVPASSPPHPAAHPGTPKLIAGIIFLGVVVSWVGTWLWNRASSRLSPAVAGLLVNLETVTGFGYVYAARHQWPPAGQLAGLIQIGR